MNREIFVFTSKEKIPPFIIERWKVISAIAIQKTGYFSVALSGGKTPEDLYRALSDEKLPWDDTYIFLVDERYVPANHPDSTYHMLQKTLLSKVKIPAHNIHPILTEKETLEQCAVAYENDIKKFFNISNSNYFPYFDLILLGIGEDGHIASLFPGHPALHERARLAAPVLLDVPKRSRVTLTFPVINNAACIFFIVTGQHKASILKRVINDEDPALPVSLVHPKSGQVIFVVDQEAGFGITQRHILSSNLWLKR